MPARVLVWSIGFAGENRWGAFSPRPEARRATRRPGAHAPGTRNRIDPAFIARGRAQWRPVVEIAAPVPTSIPAILFKSILQRSRMGSPVRGARARIARLGQRRERRERCVQE